MKKYNKTLSELKSEKQLKVDVDIAYRKLQKFHPELYWYISKEELDHKFDSLKSTINAPMTSSDFYLKLSPVIASVKQGHMKVIPPNKKLKGKESSLQNKTGTTPFSMFDFEVFDDKIYFVKNHSADSSIKPGTELVTVNNMNPLELIAKYGKTYTSDGFNLTYLERRSGRGFPAFFYYQNDITDSVLCELKFNDTLRSVYLKRKTNIDSSKKDSTVSRNDEEKMVLREKHKTEIKKRKELGYDRFTRAYSKNLSFPDPDSSIALMKINDFSRGKYRKFYSKSFSKIDSLKTKFLILDLRDNPGGKLKEIKVLYSYLVDSSFTFIDKSEVTSRTSLLHNNFFRRNLISMVLLLPAEIVYSGIVLSKVHKEEDGKYYYAWSGSKPSKPKPNSFKGEVYVLINGGSFSASCLLSSNLKGSGRAVFVGEETGGAFNGTVAGLMPLFRLPESKLNIRLGLALIRPHHKTDVDGRGIFPDIEVKPTLEDRITGNDPELNKVLKIISEEKKQ